MSINLTRRSKILLGTALVIVLPVLIIPLITFAHPGKRAADGCHYCRTNCDRWGVEWNKRHCHGGKISPNLEQEVEERFQQARAEKQRAVIREFTTKPPKPPPWYKRFWRWLKT